MKIKHLFMCFAMAVIMAATLTSCSKLTPGDWPSAFKWSAEKVVDHEPGEIDPVKAAVAATEAIQWAEEIKARDPTGLDAVRPIETNTDCQHVTDPEQNIRSPAGK